MADIRPEPGPQYAPSCELGQGTQLLELWFPLLQNGANHISLTGRACSQEIQDFGGFIDVGFHLANLFSFTTSESQEASDI